MTPTLDDAAISCRMRATRPMPWWSATRIADGTRFHVVPLWSFTSSSFDMIPHEMDEQRSAPIQQPLRIAGDPRSHAPARQAPARGDAPPALRPHESAPTLHLVMPPTIPLSIL